MISIRLNTDMKRNDSNSIALLIRGASTKQLTLESRSFDYEMHISGSIPERCIPPEELEELAGKSDLKFYEISLNFENFETSLRGFLTSLSHALGGKVVFEDVDTIFNGPPDQNLVTLEIEVPVSGIEEPLLQAFVGATELFLKFEPTDAFLQEQIASLKTPSVATEIGISQYFEDLFSGLKNDKLLLTALQAGLRPSLEEIVKLHATTKAPEKSKALS